MPPPTAANPAMSKSGIRTSATGDSYIPSSVRADGSKRKEIKVRPGYKPPEDVEVYKNRSAEAFKNRGSGGVPGAETVLTDGDPSKPEASNKNAKRREARRKAAAASQAAEDAVEGTDENKRPTAGKEESSIEDTSASQLTDSVEAVQADQEKEKKARNLKKRLKQARDLRQKKDQGEPLLPEQLTKVVKMNELIRELNMLGFDADGEKKVDVNGMQDCE